ncbi:hypothetical protein AB0J86_38755, partial [Micromonospora sp. NPDC049559]|uniref:hypothetical protein n=1 Tax=Micromonospora sp. NPDC049559 TaxID=3155923 RepID=UPI0034391A92
MEFLTVDGYVSLLLEELGRIEPPSGPVRRIGVLEHVPSALDIIRRDLNAVGAAVTAGNVAGKLGFATDLALETASYLYAAGAPHESWRRWSALTAFGRLSLHDPVTACPYLVLAGEWDCLMVLRRLAPGGGSPAARALWQLAWGAGAPPPPPGGGDGGRAGGPRLAAGP